MASKRDRLDRLERALYAARRELPAAEPGPAWRMGLANAIRRRTPGGRPGDAGYALMERFAWRLSAVAAAVAIALLVYVLASGVVDYADVASRFLDDPASFMIAAR